MTIGLSRHFDSYLATSAILLGALFDCRSHMADRRTLFASDYWLFENEGFFSLNTNIFFFFFSNYNIRNNPQGKGEVIAPANRKRRLKRNWRVEPGSLEQALSLHMATFSADGANNMWEE